MVNTTAFNDSKQTVQEAACPSCRQNMQALLLEDKMGRQLELDLCFSCHGIWFDRWENTQLSPRSVLDLFKTLHDHKDSPHTPLKNSMRCPRCQTDLHLSANSNISGQYMVYRCTQHGQFSSFSSFLTEKGFVRQLKPAEIAKLAQKVKNIHCSNCGAAVDIRKEHACPFCRSAFSLLDPNAVKEALEKYKEQIWHADAAGNKAAMANMAADVLVANERAREQGRRAKREEAIDSWFLDQWGILGMVWRLLNWVMK